MDSIDLLPLGWIRALGIRVFLPGSTATAARVGDAAIAYERLRDLIQMRVRSLFMSDVEIDVAELKRLAGRPAEKPDAREGPTRTAQAARIRQEERDFSLYEILMQRLPANVRVADLRVTGIGQRTLGLRDFRVSRTTLADGEARLQFDLETEALDAMQLAETSETVRLSASCRFGRGTFQVEEIDTNIGSLAVIQAADSGATNEEEFLSLTIEHPEIDLGQWLALLRLPEEWRFGVEPSRIRVAAGRTAPESSRAGPLPAGALFGELEIEPSPAKWNGSDPKCRIEGQAGARVAAATVLGENPVSWGKFDVKIEQGRLETPEATFRDLRFEWRGEATLRSDLLDFDGSARLEGRESATGQGPGNAFDLAASAHGSVAMHPLRMDSAFDLEPKVFDRSGKTREFPLKGEFAVLSTGPTERSQRLKAGGALLGGRWDFSGERWGTAAPRTSATLTVSGVSVADLSSAVRSLSARPIVPELDGTLCSQWTVDRVEHDYEESTLTLEVAGLEVRSSTESLLTLSRPVDVRGVFRSSARPDDPSVPARFRGRLEADDNLVLGIEEVAPLASGEAGLLVRHQVRVADVGRMGELLNAAMPAWIVGRLEHEGTLRWTPGGADGTLLSVEGEVRFEDGSTMRRDGSGADSSSNRRAGGAVVWDSLSAKGDLAFSLPSDNSSPTLAFDGDFAAKDVVAGGVRIRRVEGTWRTDGTEAECRISRADLYEGRADAVAHAVLSPWPPRAEAAGRVENLDLAAFSKEFDPGGARMAGRISAEWKGRYAPKAGIDFESSVRSVGDEIETDKETVRKLLSSLPTAGGGWLTGGDPVKTLDRKFKDRKMVPFEVFEVASRYEGERIVNRLTLDNPYFRIVLDTKVDLPVVIEFLGLRQEAMSEGAERLR